MQRELEEKKAKLAQVEQSLQKSAAIPSPAPPASVPVSFWLKAAAIIILLFQECWQIFSYPWNLASFFRSISDPIFAAKLPKRVIVCIIFVYPQTSMPLSTTSFHLFFSRPFFLQLQIFLLLLELFSRLFFLHAQTIVISALLRIPLSSFHSCHIINCFITDAIS